jgi:hypothetical protein
MDYATNYVEVVKLGDYNYVILKFKAKCPKECVMGY